ncbi:hypothetical protein [Clavibacter michiganensis]|uniref:hypothetical protein n=1 Tax=Clavibacter michiganensis TaxID=28447 RepID=UPI0005BB2EAD|nr:hypothetical protein [Clavibacter michiganensis]
MTRRLPTTTSAAPRRSVVVMVLLAAATPLAAHLAPDLAAACWSAGAVLTVGALVAAVRGRR